MQRREKREQGIDDDAVEAVGAMMTRANRQANAQAGTTAGSDRALEGMGPLFLRADRSARPVPDTGLRLEQQQAADAYETERPARQAAWETQVATDQARTEANRESTDRAVTATADEDRRAPGQRMMGESRAKHEEQFTARAGGLLTELSNAATVGRTALKGARAAITAGNAIPERFRSYDTVANTQLRADIDALAGHCPTLSADVTSLADAHRALSADASNATYRAAVAARKRVGPLTTLAAAVAPVTERATTAISSFSTETIRARMLKMITDEYTSDTKLGKMWSNATKSHVRFQPEDDLKGRTAFIEYLDERVERQHHPNKGDWLDWMKDKLGWVKWRNGLWGADTVGRLHGVNVHATRYLNDVLDADVDHGSQTAHTALLGSGTGGFHVSLEVFGKYPTAEGKNPHSYRGGPTHMNDWKASGTETREEAKVGLERLRDATVTVAEGAITELVNAHGDRRQGA